MSQPEVPSSINGLKNKTFKDNISVIVGYIKNPIKNMVTNNLKYVIVICLVVFVAVCFTYYKDSNKKITVNNFHKLGLSAYAF
jgi:hypothetical protein